MFNMPGSKIKILAKILFFLSVLAALILGILFFIEGRILSGFVVIAVGTVLSYAVCIFMSACGELMEDVSYISFCMQEIGENVEKVRKKSEKLDK